MFNVVFMGTPDFAMVSLKKIIQNGYNIVGVVTNEDKPKGRGMKIQITPVKELALAQNIKVMQPNKIKKNEVFLNELTELSPDLIVVVAYGKILPKEVLDIPKLGCINLHASLLPKYRGAAPIQWAILNGDEITGVTTMYMDTGMDTGDIILKKEVKIKEDETTGELWNRLSEIGSELLIETIEKIENGTATRTKQGNKFSMAPMITKEMSKINWNKSTTKEIINLVRGLNPIMGAYCYLRGKKIKFWKVNAIEDDIDISNVENVEPGTIINVDNKKGLYIKTIDGILSILEIQAENAKKMNILDFLRGNEIKKFEIFV